MPRLNAPAIVLLLTLAPQLGHAQNGDDYFFDAAVAVVGNVKALVRPTLTSSERRILDSIDFRVSRSHEIQGSAYKQGGRRFVEIPLGFPIVFNALAEAAFVGVKGNAACMSSFYYNLMSTISYNSDKSVPPSQRRPILMMSGYSRVEPICREARSLLDAATSREKDLIAAAKGSSLAAVVPHEIGHHVVDGGEQLDHGRSDPPTAAGLRRSRDDEDAADKWALRKLIELHTPLDGLFPFIAFFVAISDTTWEGEQMATHPAGTRRVLAVFDELLAEYRREQAPSDAIETAVRLRQMIQSALPAR
jgi:hypothetical protein